MALTPCRAISTDILDFCARVLAIQDGKGRLMDSDSIPDTVLPVSSCDRVVPYSPAVASRRTAPRVAVVGRAVHTPWSCGRGE